MAQQLDSGERSLLKGVGRRVKTVREEARLSQKALADLIGVSKGTIVNIEAGASGGNNLATLRKIAQATAGVGTLPDDEDLIRRFLIGDIPEFSVTIRDGSFIYTSYFRSIRGLARVA